MPASTQQDAPAQSLDGIGQPFDLESLDGIESPFDLEEKRFYLIDKLARGATFAFLGITGIVIAFVIVFACLEFYVYLGDKSYDRLIASDVIIGVIAGTVAQFGVVMLAMYKGLFAAKNSAGDA